jgi:uncharacterized membrane protein
MLNKAKAFLVTTAIGGIVVMLPFTVLLIAFLWAYSLVISIVSPIIDLIPLENHLLAEIVTIFCIVFFSFLVGLIIRTSLGSTVFQWLEEKCFIRLPFYKIIKETLNQFISSDSSAFQQVALVQPYADNVYMTGFITDSTLTNIGTVYTVFVPTAPNPTNGNVFHLPAEKVNVLHDVPIEVAMKTIVSCGSSSNKILAR